MGPIVTPINHCLYQILVSAPRKSDLDTADEGNEGYISPSVKPMRLPVTMSPEMASCAENIAFEVRAPIP
jgi:hypothetical protein